MTGAALYEAVIDTSKGTLWWIREDVWIEANARSGQRYTDSGRKGHPGLSWAARSLLSPYEFVPMLEGTTAGRGPVIVRGMAAEEPDRETFFGVLLSDPLPASVFIGGRRHRDPNEPPEGPWWKAGQAKCNHAKPRITKEEMRHLDGWLKMKGLA